MSLVKEISGSEFADEVLQSGVPVIVEFGADWCVPCKKMRPALEKLAQSWGDKAKFVELDVDDSIELTMKYQVMSVPTLMLYVDGQVKERLVGLQSEERIARTFEPHLP